MNVRRVSDDFKYERLGNINDGGYIVVSDKSGNFSSSKIAYSIGIGDDVSFDLALAGLSYEIYQYDHMIEKLPKDDKHFHWKKLGLAASSNYQLKLETLENMVKSNSHENTSGMFLKIDIEGYEWDVLNSLTPGFLEKFDQLVFELHGLLNYDEKIIERNLHALKTLAKAHQAVHVHANNCSFVNYCGELITPDVLEITYVLRERYKFSDEKVESLWLSLDRPNSTEREDIELGAWNVV